MNQDRPEEPFSQAHLDSPEYRERLMRKLNCLIAVLEVATTKVRQSMASPDADRERLERIRNNLQSTLDVCLRARTALERREGIRRPLPNQLARAIEQEAGEPLPRRMRPRAKAPLETGSERERVKFENLPPIAKSEIVAADLEELMRRLQLG